MGKIKLKPCPFCGDLDSVYVRHKKHWLDEFFYEGFIGCEACDFYIRTGEGYDRADEAENAAIELWNRRV